MKILGIDIGSTSIKAVELDSAFGRYEVHEYYEQKLPTDIGTADPAQIANEGLIRLLSSLPKTPDRIVLSLRSRQVTFRNLQLPTRDKKAILATVGFELDDELPFSIEQAAYDYSILSQSKAGSQIHVAATLKRNVAASLDAWSTVGIDPDLLTTEAWAFRTLFNRTMSPEEQEQPVMLLQMGHERTLIYVHWRGVPILCRELAWGGKDLTLAICQRYQTPISQAEDAKLDHGFVVPPSQQAEVSPEQAEFSNALLVPIERLFADIKQAQLTCKNITDAMVSRVYVSGGTSLLPGLSRLFEENLHLPVKPLQALSAIATSGVTYSEQADATFLLASALALCIVGSDRSLAINFRRGEFNKQGRTREISAATLKRPLMALGAIALSFFASMLVQSRFYSSRIAETNTQLERTVKSFFGNLSNSAVRTYMANTTTLRASVNKELKKERELSKLGSPNPRSPLNFLKDLSTSIPKDVVVDMVQYQVGSSPTAPYPEDAAKGAGEVSASLTFLAAPQSVERLTSVLSSKLNGIKKSGSEDAKAPDGTAKRVKITFSGTPTDDSFGK
jgi:general secretion pathway protein L